VKYAPGERVRVLDAPSIGHIRTPEFIKGKTGWVERMHGEFRNPESLAYGGDGLPKQPLYLVRFRQHDVWPRYSGPARDSIYVDLYEHWLERP
jgi:hypothetical protein